jgi:hypothetical protein
MKVTDQTASAQEENMDVSACNRFAPANSILLEEANMNKGFDSRLDQACPTTVGFTTQRTEGPCVLVSCHLRRNVVEFAGEEQTQVGCFKSRCTFPR